jgi:hypothetical protein
MTTAVGIRGLQFSDEDLQPSDLSIFLQIVTGLDDLAAVRGVDTVVPGLTGRIPRERIADVRAIELAGWVQGVGEDEDARRADYRDSVLWLQTLFDPTAPPDVLEVTLESGGTATINARPLLMVWGEETVPCVRQVSVALESVDPNWVVTGS